MGAALADLRTKNVFPTEVGLDLYVLALHVYAADTRISRDTESDDAWTREIRLVVPVSDVPRWSAAEGGSRTRRGAWGLFLGKRRNATQ